MARGHARAPSQNAYRGAIGRTQTATVHVTGPTGDLIIGTVYTTIDAVSDPELALRLHTEDPERALNIVAVDGTAPLPIAAPVVYHDPAAELMVLVLGESHRHREIDERIALLQRLRDDAAPIPSYVKDFAVVFGATGLHAYLESRAQAALQAARSADGAKESERRRAEVAARDEELARQRQELERQRQELERQRQEVDRGKGQLEQERTARLQAQGDAERLRGELRARVIASVQPPEETMISAAPSGPSQPSQSQIDDGSTRPVVRQELDHVRTRSPSDIPTGATAPALPAAPSTSSADFESLTDAQKESPAFSAFRSNGVHTPEFDEEQTGIAIVPPGADPLTTETVSLPPAQDPWIDFAATGQTSSFEVTTDSRVRLALVTGEQIARGMGTNLDVRLLLHRVNTYPVVTLVIGPPAALRVPSPTQLAVLPLDIANDLDRAVITALAKHFELTVVVIHHGVPIRTVRISAPLADNAAYILRAADDHLRGISADGQTEPSFQRARDLVLGAGYDLLGTEHAEASEFRDDKLAQLQTAQQLRRAIAIARRFVRPSREDYLICARGFPLARWRDLRHHVLESAVSWGIWMGPELAQVAVSEGMARSRRDLISKLDTGFEALRRHPTANDIDDDAADDNLKAIADEAKALGVELRRKSANGMSPPIKSEDVPVVSGSIEGLPSKGLLHSTSVDELLKLLDDKKDRVAAATELCDRGESRAATAVISAVRKMSRAEAVRILGKSVKFGPAAAPSLIEGLTSSKAYLRHGCALALALLRTEEGTHAVIELLLSEPTEIWREIARALGQVGPAALMPLAAQAGHLGGLATPGLAERVSWAMAHVGVRGGKPALEQMASGQSMVAPIAHQALALLETAARDEVRVRPGPQAGRDVTVNRQFSRRFFEALEPAQPEVAQQAIHDLDASAPLEMLDEADLIADDEDEAELDESDLIQT